MSNPLSLLWPSIASTTSAIAGSQETVAWQPLILNTNGAGCPLIIPDMERSLAYQTDLDCIFDVKGSDSFGNPVTDTANITGGSLQYDATLFHRIDYILPHTSGVRVQIGYGKQGHMYYQADFLRNTWGCSVQAQVLTQTVGSDARYTLFTNLVQMQTVNIQQPTSKPLLPGSPITVYTSAGAVQADLYFNTDALPGDPWFPLGTSSTLTNQQIIVPYVVSTVGASIGLTTGGVISEDVDFSMLLTVLQMGIS